MTETAESSNTTPTETSNVTKNINEINFEDNKPWFAPHFPFSLEGHWQPWYDDRRDYNTNAPTYYDYLSNFNHLIKSITELLNRVARRNINLEDTHCIDLTKIGDWIDEGNKCHTYSDVITLKAEVILSTYQKALEFDGNQYTLDNIISCLETGLYSPDYLPLINHLKDKLNQEIQDRKDADKALDTKLDKEIQDRKDADTNLQNQVTNLQSKADDLTSKVNTLTRALETIVNNLFGGGNATSNDLNSFTINGNIASGNINVYGGTPDGDSLIRTHSGSGENDLAGGI